MLLKTQINVEILEKYIKIVDNGWDDGGMSNSFYATI